MDVMPLYPPLPQLPSLAPPLHPYAPPEHTRKAQDRLNAARAAARQRIQRIQQHQQRCQAEQSELRPDPDLGCGPGLCADQPRRQAFHPLTLQVAARLPPVTVSAGVTGATAGRGSDAPCQPDASEVEQQLQQQQQQPHLARGTGVDSPPPLPIEQFCGHESG
eukprot:scaffold227748_cov18-Tisochrysis_lutea.AAC.2